MVHIELLPVRFVTKTRKDTVHTLKAWLNLSYLLCIVTSIKLSPILYLVWRYPEVLCFLAICTRLLANHEAIWMSRKMLTLGLGEVPKHCCHNSYNKPMNQTLLKNNCQRCDSVWRHLPATVIMKAVPSSSDSKYQLHSCRPLMPNSMGQSTDDDKAGLCLFGMKFKAIERSKG
jgi:hypothetical protein